MNKADNAYVEPVEAYHQEPKQEPTEAARNGAEAYRSGSPRDYPNRPNGIEDTHTVTQRFQWEQAYDDASFNQLDDYD